MDNDEKIRIALGMVSEMLQLAEAQDVRHCKEAIARGKGEEAIGKSWEVFHLKNLKDLLEK
jgi:hypothetical protein